MTVRVPAHDAEMIVDDMSVAAYRVEFTNVSFVFSP
jgi:hypothetical protein